MGFTQNCIEIAVGSVASRGKIIPYSELSKYINESQELYRSMFTLEDSALDSFESIKDYKGLYKLKHLIFDIDRKDDSGAFTMDRTHGFIKQLIDMGVDKDHIQIWFSGRGFHVEIPDYFGFQPSKDLPQIVKLTLHNEFGDEIDNIYDKGRIIRVNYTLNAKSKLYKTPIKLEEFDEYLPFEDVEMMAKDFIREDYTPNPLPMTVKPIWKGRIQYQKQTASAGIQTALEVKSDNTYMSHVVCVQKMREVANNKGHRHQLLLRMSNGWRRAGIDKAGVIVLSKMAIPSMKESEIIRTVDYVFDWTHNGYSCNDSVMEKYCDKSCKFYKDRNYGVQALNADMLMSRLKDFVFRDSVNSFDLADIYQLGHSYMFNPGEFVVMIGDVKLGKTAWVQNLVAKVKHLKTLFLSLEVSDHLIYRRFIQISNKLDKNTVLSRVREGKEEELMKPLNHLSVITSCDIDALKEEIVSQDAKLIIIDTLDGLDVKGYVDAFKKQEKIADSLMKLAHDLNVIIIGINHISKGASYNLQNMPMLNVHSAKGSSALEQKADKILGIEGIMDAKERRVRSIASRDENGFSLSFKFNTDTMEFQQEMM